MERAAEDTFSLSRSQPLAEFVREEGEQRIRDSDLHFFLKP
jgi:hypothetical protein